MPERSAKGLGEPEMSVREGELPPATESPRSGRLPLLFRRGSGGSGGLRSCCDGKGTELRCGRGSPEVLRCDGSSLLHLRQSPCAMRRRVSASNRDSDSSMNSY